MEAVLIIDDEFGIVEALTALLNDEGYRVHSAPDGKQGLGKLDQVRPDVILLDFMMPIIDGPGVLRALRAHPVWNRVPVVMMSAVPERTVRELCGDSFQAFLHKPFNVDHLMDLLHAPPWQARRGAQPASPPPAFSAITPVRPAAEASAPAASKPGRGGR
jgi:CheY-like chemotaxis protein